MFKKFFVGILFLVSVSGAMALGPCQAELQSDVLTLANAYNSGHISYDAFVVLLSDAASDFSTCHNGIPSV